MSAPGRAGTAPFNSRLGAGRESELIRTLLARAGGLGARLPEGVRTGPGDDCAHVTGDGIVLSCDLSIEDVHFRRAWLSPQEIGYRATAAALSDLAAVAARPLGVLVSVAVPAEEADDLLPALGDGIAEALRHAGGALLGGDLSRAGGGIVIDVVAVGAAARPVLRSGALPGDALWVTGRLGGSAAAVRAWEAGKTPGAEARLAFARPSARIEEARWLAERGVLHALIDLSDGLARDAGHLAAASGVDIVVEAARVPIHAAAADAAVEPVADAAVERGEAAIERGEAAIERGADDAPPDPAPLGSPLDLALRGGEDYELCFAAPAEATEALRPAFEARFELPLTRVGRVEEGSGEARLDRGSGTSVPLAGGHDHFGGGAAGGGGPGGAPAADPGARSEARADPGVSDEPADRGGPGGAP